MDSLGLLILFFVIACNAAAAAASALSGHAARSPDRSNRERGRLARNYDDPSPRNEVVVQRAPYRA